MRILLISFFISTIFISISNGAENERSSLAANESDFKSSFSVKAEKQILSSYDGAFVGSSAFSIGYRLSEKWDFYLDHIVATNYIFGTAGTINLTSYGAGSRYFFSSTSYFKGGVSRQDIVRSCDDWKIGMTVYVLDVSIGNEWKINHFIIGADWIGFYSQSLYSKTNVDTPSSLSPDSYASAKHAMTDTGRLRGPNFYIGYSF